MVDWKRTQERLAAPPAVQQRPAGLGFFVIFTTPEETLAALREAGALARGLDARITLLVAREVPYPLPLSEPPVPVQFTEERVRALVESSGTGASVQVLLCRERREVILRALPPASLLVLGGRKPWWRRGRTRGLAKLLARDGHKVVFVKEFPGL